MTYQIETELFHEQFVIEENGSIKAIMTPTFVRIYDNGGETCDRYTIVFTSNYPGRDGCNYLGLSDDPNSLHGFCQHGWHNEFIDRPTYTHLGKSISFKDLPDECQRIVLEDYKILWEV